jgi:SAM-dependent methyltransferase
MHNVERGVLAALRRSGPWPLAGQRILDVGCGSGHWLRRLITWGARPRHAAGIDLLRYRLGDAASLSPRDLGLCCGSAATLPFLDASFYLLLQFTVFTSILDPDCRRRVADEMVRVLKPNGSILWYDFCVDNPRNRDVRAVKVAEIERLFPTCEVDVERVTLAPPIARLVASRSWTLCVLLNLLAPLRTHLLGVLRKR